MSRTTSLPFYQTALDSARDGVLRTVFQFMMRRRVTISAVLFVGVIIGDFALGVRPRDVLDWRDALSMFGLTLVTIGLALRSWAAGILIKDRQLATAGPYRLMRHPLYVGSFLMMFGFCALMGSPITFGLILVPMVLLYLVRIHDEERGLARYFGANWNEYSKQTPRFFPRTLRTSVWADWSLARWLKQREYRAVGTTLAALLALRMWSVM